MSKKIDYEAVANNVWKLAENPFNNAREERVMKDAALAIRDLQAQIAATAKLPQSEGADWFVVLCPRDGVVFCYDADLGRSFGHDHIKDAMEDDRAGLAKNWVVRPAFAQAQPIKEPK